MLAELYASRYSVVRPDQAKHGVLAFQPVLEKGYIGILAQIRANLLALGLERREPAELGPLELAEQIDREEAEKEARAAEQRPESPQDRLSSQDLPDTTDETDDPTGGENSSGGGG
jgi:hypothetical protein